MPTRLPSLRRPPIGFAHRGARANAPENTLEAFALAVRLGATGLESDVWLTADGEAVLDHDGVVRRGLRKRPIADAATGPSCPTHIPTLAELYAAVGTDLELSLDVKDPAAFDRTVAVARAAGGGALERLWLCHHDWRAGGARGGRACPEVRLVDSTFLGRMPDGPEQRAAALADAGHRRGEPAPPEWTGGLDRALPPLRACSASAGTRSTTGSSTSCSTPGIDAVYCDHVDRMVDALDRARR